MKKAPQAGFTLIELVVVIVILGILAAVAIPQFSDLSAAAKTAKGEAVCGALQSSAVLLYASKKTSSTAAQIISNTTYTGGTLAGTCAAPTFTDSDTTTVTNCSALPSPVLCNG